NKDFNSDGQVDDVLLIQVAATVGLLQTFFQREGESLLDEFNEILEVFGYLEIENSEEYDTFAVLVNSVGKGAKGGLKKAVKMFWKVEGSRKFYPQRTYVSAAISVAGLTSAAMGIYIGLTGDADEDLILAMDTLALVSETLGTIDALYSFYKVSQGGFETAKQAMATITKLEQSTKMSAAIGLVFDIGISTLFFTLSALSIDKDAQSFVLHALIARFIAEVIVAIITFIIASTIVGALILAVLGLIDTMIAFICNYLVSGESEDVEKWVCGGITGIVTELLVYAIYDMAIVADLEAKNRLDFALGVPIFGRGDLSTQDGVMQGNTVTLRTDVTNTLKMGSPTGLGSSYASITGQFFTNQNLKRSSFAYDLQDNDEDVHYGSLAFGDFTWPNRQEAFIATHIFDFDQAGINQPPGSVYLAESFKIPAMECWGFVTQYCYQRVFRDAIHYDLTGQFLFDVFPANFTEFVTMIHAGDGGYRMAWDGTNFPVLWDADGDGLVSQVMGGADPNDSMPDSDLDGLPDFYEYEHGTDMLNSDSDSDGLSDYWESVYVTHPYLADSDGDGLLDGEELFHPDSLFPYENNSNFSGNTNWSGGWEIVYGQAG
ncbi:MAG: hypothetical protein GY943_12565, partial [Chloroflexi bacterium]|nr:hypothetical protein [Chloroflexota bacterium]